MPFKNQAQVRACFAQYHRDIKAGRVPAWDCYKWLDETPKRIKSGSKSKSRKSRRSNSSKSRSRTSKSRLSPKRSRKRKVYTGSRGGKYVIVKGRKIYI